MDCTTEHVQVPHDSENPSESDAQELSAEIDISNESDCKPDSGDKSKYKYGIIYLSYIPDGLNVTSVREIMSQWGEVGRIYLEPDENNITSKRKRYTEGWVEFKKKRIAKEVAKFLNGTVLQYGKKHSRVSGQIWSIKYLHRFKWTQLTDQLSHQKAVEEQKRRFEMDQAKKQVDFYQKMTERSKIMKKKRSHAASNLGPQNLKESAREKMLKARQNKPMNRGSELSVPVGEDLLSSIFKKVT